MVHKQNALAYGDIHNNLTIAWQAIDQLLSVRDNTLSGDEVSELDEDCELGLFTASSTKIGNAVKL